MIQIKKILIKLRTNRFINYLDRRCKTHDISKQGQIEYTNILATIFPLAAVYLQWTKLSVQTANTRKRN